MNWPQKWIKGVFSIWKIVWLWLDWFSKNSWSTPFFGSNRYIQLNLGMFFLSEHGFFENPSNHSQTTLYIEKTVFIQFRGHLVNYLNYFHCYDSQKLGVQMQKTPLYMETAELPRNACCWKGCWTKNVYLIKSSKSPPCESLNKSH